MPTTVAMYAVLWHRMRKGEPWTMLDQFATEREAVFAIRGKGEFVILPAGQQP